MRTDMQKLIIAFRNFVNAHKKTMGWTNAEESRWNVIPYGQNVSFYTY